MNIRDQWRELTVERMSSRRPRGFTLIELMVAVAVTAIIATVAVTSYSSFVLKAHRTEAKSALLGLASLEERYLSTNTVYTSSSTALGYSGSWPILVGSGYYQVQQPVLALPVLAVAGTPAIPAGFTITAIPKPGGQQAGDTACASFTVTSTGARTALNASGVDNSATCWQ